MKLRCSFAAAAWLLLAGSAVAQTVPTLPRNGRDARGQPLVLPRDVETAFGKYVDLGGPATMTGRVPTGCELMYSGTPNVVADSTLCLTPPPDTKSTRPLYQINVNLVASPSSGTGDKVAIYGRVISKGGIAGIWAMNTVTDIAPHVDGTQRPLVAAGYEIDLDNSDCDAGVAPNVTDPACYTTSRGLWITGLTGAGLHAATEAMVVTGSGPNAMWHYGLRFAGPYVNDISISDETNSTKTLQVTGTHGDVIDTTGSTVTNAVLHMKENQKVCFVADCTSYVMSVPQVGVVLQSGGAQSVVFHPSLVEAKSLSVTADMNVGGATTLTGVYARVVNLPDVDPHEAGRLWRSASGAMMVSVGP